MRTSARSATVPAHLPVLVSGRTDRKQAECQGEADVVCTIDAAGGVPRRGGGSYPSRALIRRGGHHCDQGAYLHRSLLIAGMLALTVVRPRPIVQRRSDSDRLPISRESQEADSYRQIGEAHHE